MNKKALITGITGQDGSYLAELLLEKGYEVHGIIRRSSSFNTGRILHLFQDPHEQNLKLHLHYADMEDSGRLTNLLRTIQPDEVYNLAAQSHVRTSFDIPEYTGDVTALGAIKLLEAIRASETNCKFYQASSSELFGRTPPPQNENTLFYPRSPYAVAKLYAYWSTINYREAYGIFAVNGILFNHESPRRGETFVTRKIAIAAAKIAMKQQNQLYLGNLDAIRDWGYAQEYVEAMWLMLQNETPTDFVVSTGIGSTVEQFAQACFSRLDLDYRDYIKFDDRYLRPTEVDSLIGDPSKIKKELGWTAKTNWKDLAYLMVDHEIASLREKVQ
jgi:GDPmannose 4,6-dehydratase